MKYNKTLIITGIFLLISICCIVNLNLATLYNGQNEELTYSKITFNSPQSGVVQFNRTVPAGMNIRYEDIYGNTLNHDSNFDGNSNTVRINIINETNEIFEIYTTASVSETDLVFDSKPYWIDPVIDKCYINDNIPIGTSTYYIEKQDGYTPNNENTMEFFNDGSTLNGLSTEGSPVISSGAIYLTGDAVYHTFDTGFPMIIIFKTKYSNVVTQYSNFICADESDNRAITLNWGEPANDIAYFCGSYYEIADYTPAVYNIYKVIVPDYTNEIYEFYKDGIEIKTDIPYRVTPTEQPNVVKFNDNPSYSNPTYIDWFYVYKYNDISSSITDMGSYYKIDIINNEGQIINDYQVELNCSELNITSIDDSIYINNMLSTENLIEVSRSEVYPLYTKYFKNATINEDYPLIFESNFSYHEWYIEGNLSDISNSFSPSIVLQNATNLTNITLYSYENDRLMEINDFEINVTENGDSENVRTVTVTNTVTNTVTETVTKAIVVDNEDQKTVISTNQEKDKIEFSTNTSIIILFGLMGIVFYILWKK